MSQALPKTGLHEELARRALSGYPIGPIDFSLCGFAYYLFDVGICVCNLKPPLRRTYLAGYGAGYRAGYGQALTPGQRHLTEAFIIMIILISAARHVTNPEWLEWFQRRFTRIARQYGPMLLRREAFLFDI
jgi:hypothetical protein